MVRLHPRLLVLFALVGGFPCLAADIPTDWVESDTGHRINRLSSDNESSSLYFHQNSYTPEGDKVIFDTPRGIAAVDLTTLGSKPPQVDILVSNGYVLTVSRKAREVYCSRNGGLWAVNVDTHKLREILASRVIAVNCDETFAVRTTYQIDPSGKVTPPEARKILPQRERMFGDKINA
jgi:oligogalacturonide lyase